MGDTNEYTVHDLVRDELYKNMDVEYGKFTASLSCLLYTSDAADE